MWHQPRDRMSVRWQPSTAQKVMRASRPPAAAPPHRPLLLPECVACPRLVVGLRLRLLGGGAGLAEAHSGGGEGAGLAAVPARGGRAPFDETVHAHAEAGVDVGGHAMP